MGAITKELENFDVYDQSVWEVIRRFFNLLNRMFNIDYTNKSGAMLLALLGD